ncbi:winged helix-turn-helix domain-containing protein [Saccharopolyspora taberi]|uniref:OmpR/PhoB-type domain-containing protein n=1 Tax=Saccharopolyspora taberi TaxID=60895 RepID=A0ABN3V3A0_9PSEU
MSADSAADSWDIGPAPTQDTAVLEVVARVVVHRDSLDQVGAYVARELRALAEQPSNPRVRIQWDGDTAPEPDNVRQLPRPAENARLRILVAPRVVLLDGNPVQLTRLEFDLFLFLCENPGWVHRRQPLLREVWGIDAAVSTRTVDVHVRRLRNKFGPELDFITTIRGVGYRFDGADHVAIDYGRA